MQSLSVEAIRIEGGPDPPLNATMRGREPTRVPLCPDRPGPEPAAGRFRQRNTLLKRLHVGILIFEDVEVLDFAGPYEVFSRTRLEPGAASRRSEATAPFRVFTVSDASGPVTATGGLKVTADFTLGTCPPIHILVVPGGFGTRPLLQDAALIDWIRHTSGQAHTTTSVCTGALLLAKAGLLEGRRATTHWGAHDLLAQTDPTVQVERKARFVDDTIITSAGVSAGIDMAFYVVEKLAGKEVARETAHYIDYPYRPGNGPSQAV